MSEFMKAVVVSEKNKVEIIHDLPKPVPGPYEALVKIHSCGFCNGTDFHIIDGSLTKEEGLGDYPTVLGHEGCGDIVELGSKCRYLKMGGRYIRPNMYKPAEKYTLTYGNMCEYALVVDHKAMLEDGIPASELPFYGNAILGYSPNFAEISREIDPIDGGVMLSLCECVGSVTDFGIGAGHSVLVYGCGPMGQASIHVMTALGAKVVAVDGVEDRLEATSKIPGVEQVINFTKEEVADALKGKKFDFSYDAVGSVGIIEASSHFLKPGGKVCGLGVISAGKDLLNLHNMANNTSYHVHMQPYNRFSYMPKTVDMVLSGKLNPKDFYSHVMPMEDIHKAMELVKAKKCLKVILTID